MSDDEDWTGEPPEGRHSRDRSKPGFWENQWQAGAAYALLGITVIAAILVIVVVSVLPMLVVTVLAATLVVGGALGLRRRDLTRA